MKFLILRATLITPFLLPISLWLTTYPLDSVQQLAVSEDTSPPEEEVVPAFVHGIDFDQGMIAQGWVVLGVSYLLNTSDNYVTVEFGFSPCGTLPNRVTLEGNDGTQADVLITEGVFQPTRLHPAETLFIISEDSCNIDGDPRSFFGAIKLSTLDVNS